MTDDEIIAINRDTFFATDDTAAHWLAFGRAIERRTLERAAAACDERAKAARVFCKARNLPDYIAVEAEGLGRTIRALGAK